jgi:hypothetical protein
MMSVLNERLRAEIRGKAKDWARIIRDNPALFAAWIENGGLEVALVALAPSQFPDDANSLEAFDKWWNKPMFREGLDDRQVAYMAFYFGRYWQGRRMRESTVSAPTFDEWRESYNDWLRLRAALEQCRTWNKRVGNWSSQMERMVDDALAAHAEPSQKEPT